MYLLFHFFRRQEKAMHVVFESSICATGKKNRKVFRSLSRPLWHKLFTKIHCFHVKPLTIPISQPPVVDFYPFSIQLLLFQVYFSANYLSYSQSRYIWTIPYPLVNLGSIWIHRFDLHCALS